MTDGFAAYSGAEAGWPGGCTQRPGKTMKEAKNERSNGDAVANDGVEIIQPASMWRRTAQLNGIVVRSNLFRVDAGCHVYLETAATINGPWHTAVDLTTAGVAETTLSSASTTDLLSAYLRWRVVYTGASGTAWTVCFKLIVYPSAVHQGKLQLNPRMA